MKEFWADARLGLMFLLIFLGPIGILAILDACGVV